MPNTLPQLAKAKRRLQVLLCEHNPLELCYALESTATYHFPLMRAWGGKPCIVNPGLSCSFKARKTDRIDVFKLATQHLHGLWKESYVPDGKTELLRVYTRTRHRLIALQTRLYNTINTRLWQYALHDLKTTARTPLVRAAIEDLAADRYTASLPQFEMHKFVPHGFWAFLVNLYGEIDHLAWRTHKLEQAIVDLSDDDLRNRLQTYPGVGPVTASIWLAEVEPYAVFPLSSDCGGRGRSVAATAKGTLLPLGSAS